MQVYATALASQKLSGLCLWCLIKAESSTMALVHVQWEAHSLPPSAAPHAHGRPWAADYTAEHLSMAGADFLLQRHSSLK